MIFIKIDICYQEWIIITIGNLYITETIIEIPNFFTIPSVYLTPEMQLFLIEGPVDMVHI